MSHWSTKDTVVFAVLLLALLYFGRMAWVGSTLGVPGVILAILAIAQHLWRLRRRPTA